MTEEFQPNQQQFVAALQGLAADAWSNFDKLHAYLERARSEWTYLWQPSGKAFWQWLNTLDISAGKFSLAEDHDRWMKWNGIVMADGKKLAEIAPALGGPAAAAIASVEEPEKREELRTRVEAFVKTNQAVPDTKTSRKLKNAVVPPRARRTVAQQNADLQRALVAKENRCKELRAQVATLQAENEQLRAKLRRCRCGLG